jgi:dATP pyrophosphohydrolase
MARAPFQILVFLYLEVGGSEYEYALLKRSDAGWWQGIAGGAEDNETPLEAARRETNEEAGIAGDSKFLP